MSDSPFASDAVYSSPELRGARYRSIAVTLILLLIATFPVGNPLFALPMVVLLGGMSGRDELTRKALSLFQLALLCFMVGMTWLEFNAHKDLNQSAWRLSAIALCAASVFDVRWAASRAKRRLYQD